MKSTFKDFLVESTATHAIKTLNLTKLDAKDLIAAMVNAGHHVIEYTSDIQVAYKIYNSKRSMHVYYMLWKDKDAVDKDKSYSINMLYVYLGKDGKIECDTDVPDYSKMTKDDAVKKFDYLKKRHDE